MSFDPYIHFQGNCAEAMTFYSSLFGADDLQIMRYSQTPDGPPEFAGSDLVLHASLVLGGRVLMASDYPPGMPGLPQQSVSVSHTLPDAQKARAVFDALSEGGAEIMAFGETFFCEGFGMVRDRFGTHWMIGGPMKEFARASRGA